MATGPPRDAPPPTVKHARDKAAHVVIPDELMILQIFSAGTFPG
jgi:hypothetical protein